MPESDETRELGGLARSIDALFSQRPPAPTVEAEVPEEPGPSELESGLAAAGESEALEPEAEVEDAFEPDPFESIDSVDAPPDDFAALPDAEEPTEEAADEELAADWMDLTSADETPVDDGFEPAELPEPGITVDGDTTDVAADLDGLPQLDAEPEQQAAEPDPDVEQPLAEPVPSGPPPSDALTTAVDAFLAGHPGAGSELEGEARVLQERLALDPLADAVERLVFSADDSEDDPALLMAGKLTSPAVASRLVQRTAAEEDEGRRAQYLSLGGRLGMVMANAYKGVLTAATDTRTRRACYDGLIAMGDEGRPVIEAMIEDDNRFLVRNGVAILGEMGGEGAVELVTSALANTDFRVRREAVTALAELGGEESGQLVMASLDDPDATVRAAAAEAAGRLGIDRALKPILALLDDDGIPDDEKVRVQIQALKALGHLGDPGAVQAIEKRAVGSLFSKPPTEVRVAAYRALHAIGTPHARELIEKAKSDKDAVVRTTARGFGSE